MKVIQDVLGHADITTTMNIYTEATKISRKRKSTSLQSSYLQPRHLKERRKMTDGNKSAAPVAQVLVPAVSEIRSLLEASRKM